MLHLPQLSEGARTALQEELNQPKYKDLDQDLATFQAAQSLLQKEVAEEILIFDRSNPSDEIVILLAS